MFFLVIESFFIDDFLNKIKLWNYDRYLCLEIIVLLDICEVMEMMVMSGGRLKYYCSYEWDKFDLLIVYV